jgi:hypothetical protein
MSDRVTAETEGEEERTDPPNTRSRYEIQLGGTLTAKKAPARSLSRSNRSEYGSVCQTNSGIPSFSPFLAATGCV